jgi:hypothetical protein
VCGAFEYDFVIITLILAFQALLKWAGATEAGGHPEGLVDCKDCKQNCDGPRRPDTYGGGSRWLTGGWYHSAEEP